MVEVQKQKVKSEVTSTLSTQVKVTNSSGEDAAELDAFRFDEVVEFTPNLVSELNLGYDSSG